MLQKDSIF